MTRDEANSAMTSHLQIAHDSLRRAQDLAEEFGLVYDFSIPNGAVTRRAWDDSGCSSYEDTDWNSSSADC